MSTTRHLVRQIQVTDVLDQYTHAVEFEASTPFVIIYGPNGIGKTKFLEVIDGLVTLRWRTLLNIPFGTATVTFTSGTTLSVRRSVVNDGDEQELNLDFSLLRLGEGPVDWSVEGSANRGFENWLKRETLWVQISGTSWEDQSDGELADITDLERRYGRSAQLAGANSPTRASKPPEELKAFVDQVHTHLIETQRLKIADESADRIRHTNSPARRASSTIVGYANDMQRLLSTALAENSRITQQLDRTFPSRMLTQAPSPASSEQDIRKKYEQQDTFRSRLAQIALIGLEPELSLPERELTRFEISMLDLYLKDADSKLESFESLLEKISLLERVINARLLGKSLRVDARSGIAVHRNSDDTPLDLGALSSGEQHEIILMYDLLFNVQPGSLVLIDEPEISLHISWQVNFIDDVKQISGLAGFQFLVATHSPQIINTWWGHAKKLGPEDADF